MPDLIVKTFEDRQVRIQDKHGEFWFSGKDVCRILGLVNVGDALARIKSKERDHIVSTDVAGKAHKINIISEPGLYRLIFTSRKLEAERFQEWVFHEVLPSIRKTGKYAIASVPTLLPMTADSLIETIGKLAELLRSDLGGMDERDRIILKDHAINSVILLTSGKDIQQSEEYRHVTISARVLELGHTKAAMDTRMLQKIGKKAAQLYRQKYGEDPPKHDQLVHGATRRVFTYFRKDLDLLDQAIYHFLGAGKVVSLHPSLEKSQIDI